MIDTISAILFIIGVALIIIVIEDIIYKEIQHRKARK